MQLQRLRDATKKHHERLEKDLDWFRPTFTRDQYIEVLCRLYGFHQPWEREAEARLEPELPGFFVARRKLGNIEADLRYLGLKVEDLSRISPCMDLPQMRSVGSTLGSVYVIEGSSLGGRILTRHFGEHLGMRSDAGCRFFAGYGEGTGQMWSGFRELVSNRPPADSDEMVAAAVSTFELLGQWLGNGSHS